MNHYILDENGEPVQVDMMTAGIWREMNQDACRVGRDDVGNGRISTVFLCLDHNWMHGEPILWETMVFGGELDGEQVRYHTRKEAEEGHRAMVSRVANFKGTYA